MYYIPIQPLSQNLAWGGGRRFKSKRYQDYEPAIKSYLHTFTLPKINPKEEFYLYLEFGIPYRQDLTNGIKLLEDIIADHLGVNDRDVMGVFCRKIKTKKADCFIRFNVFLHEYDLIKAIQNNE